MFNSAQRTVLLAHVGINQAADSKRVGQRGIDFGRRIEVGKASAIVFHSVVGKAPIGQDPGALRTDTQRFIEIGDCFGISAHPVEYETSPAVSRLRVRVLRDRRVKFG